MNSKNILKATHFCKVYSAYRLPVHLLYLLANRVVINDRRKKRNQGEEQNSRAASATPHDDYHARYRIIRRHSSSGLGRSGAFLSIALVCTSRTGSHDVISRELERRRRQYIARRERRRRGGCCEGIRTRRLWRTLLSRDVLWKASWHSSKCLINVPTRFPLK